ncbi:MAG: molybdopterin biosynthesis protein [Rhodospirillaceae bacterium]
MSEAKRRAALWRAARQEQFLNVVSRDEAEARFRSHLKLEPLGVELVSLALALGRVLAGDVSANVDVPGFDRASVDGFAIRAADTEGCGPDAPASLLLNDELLTPGVVPAITIAPGSATAIATGGMMPRGADAVVMIEHTEATKASGGDDGIFVEIGRAAVPGQFIAAAGSDIASGETVLRAGQVLCSREIGMLAAIGLGFVTVWRRPRVALFSTGDEIVPPGDPLAPGQVHDCNMALLAATISELGGEPVPLGIIADNEEALAHALNSALTTADMVVLSGGTSKGAGDLASKVASRLTEPGVVVHGVALKPGKPLCLAVSAGKPVVILPGFPTSAIFTFHEFVAPIIRILGGRPPNRRETVAATLPVRLASERGRTEYVMVSLVRGADEGLAAYPIAKGSGSVTSFARADGFFPIPAAVEMVAAGTPIMVQRLTAATEPADLVVIGSHCVGLDALIGRLEREDIRVRAINIGSSGGLAAAKRGECDVAGIHLFDPASNSYNRSFLSNELELIPGYGRLLGVVFRQDDPRFAQGPTEAAVAKALADPDCVMINRNAGSGTRILIDRLIGTFRPAGFFSQARSHNAVAVAVSQGRADWGVAIETVVRHYGLGFLPLQAERYDFVIPKTRRQRPQVRRFVELLDSEEFRATLTTLGFAP